MEVTRIKTAALETNKGQIEGLPANPRQWTRPQLERLKKSITETPELLEARGVLCIQHGKKFVALGGNMRLEACRELHIPEVPCIVIPADTPVSKLKELVIKDNGTFGENDYEALANEWDDLPLSDWGLPAWSAEEDAERTEDEEREEIERKRKEFEERIAAGEISEEDEEYQEFLEKFKLKKTTDDCYTPPLIYDAVADWVAKEYGVSRADFVRPFYPGGDYQRENYPKGCVVVDNPPFSILAEIVRFYSEKGVKFFLFAPTLTLFASPTTGGNTTALPLGVAVTYDNGAGVNTSFLTNLGDCSIRLRSVPTLYAAVKAANDKNLAQMRKELPKYSYDHHIVTSSFVGQLSRLGIEFSVPVAESEMIRETDAQKAVGKSIYGNAYLVSDRVFLEREKAEREKAEREKAEREKAERWELSERERKIIAKLNGGAR